VIEFSQLRNMNIIIQNLFILIICQSKAVLSAPGVDFRVIGHGEDVDPTEAHNNTLHFDKPSAERYSWLLPIHRNKSTGTEFARCAADLISSKFLLTAAHCLCEPDGSDVNVQILLIGKPSPSTSVDRSNFYKVKNYTCHPGWNENGRIGPHDIALIELFTEIKEVQPVGLASSDIVLSGAEKFTALGWGLDENQNLPKHLKKVELLQAENGTAQCALHYPTHFVINQGNVICTIATKGKDACGGDSGGPLLLKNEETDILVGVVTYGDSKKCAPIGPNVSPSIFTDVRPYLEWINSFIQ